MTFKEVRIKGFAGEDDEEYYEEDYPEYGYAAARVEKKPAPAPKKRPYDIAKAVSRSCRIGTDVAGLISAIAAVFVMVRKAKVLRRVTKYLDSLI